MTDDYKVPNSITFKLFGICAAYLLILLLRPLWVQPLFSGQSAGIPAAFFENGNEKYRQGDYSGAIADYKKAIDINPRYADAYSNRGLARYKLGDLQGAIKDFDRAIEINPIHTDAYNNRGAARDELGDYTGAIADYDRVIELDPNYADAFTNRGAAKHALGDYLGAIADYRHAIDLNPENAVVYSNLGTAHEMKGDYIAAVKSYQSALDLDSHLEKARARLKDLLQVLDVNPGFVGKIQSMLAGNGYYKGPVDGVQGPKTHTAIYEYQGNRHLTPTGHVDGATFAALSADDLGRVAAAPRELLGNKDNAVVGAIQVTSPEENLQTAAPDIPLEAKLVASSPIDSIVIRLNGKKWKGPTAIDYSSDRTVASLDDRIPLEQGDNQIALIAFAGKKLFRKKIKVNRRHSSSGTNSKREKWAVIIGVADYIDPEMQDLKYAVNDAEDFAQILIRNFAFPPDHICLLTDESYQPLKGVLRKQPTAANIRKAVFSDLLERQKGDTLVIYFSGHGALVPDPTVATGQVAYLAPVDYKKHAPEVNGIELERVKRRAFLPPERIFLIIDSCFSGGGQTGAKTVTTPGLAYKSVHLDITGGFAQIGKGRILISSSQSHQVSIESEDLKNSVFTYFWVEALTREKGLSEVFGYVYDHVRDYTHGNQLPIKDSIMEEGRIVLF
jgi:tetratricopeptide (TPR) repeat protein